MLVHRNGNDFLLALPDIMLEDVLGADVQSEWQLQVDGRNYGGEAHTGHHVGKEAHEDAVD